MENENDPRQSAAWVSQLRAALLPHMMAEERVLYPAVRQYEDARTQQWATEALQGHQTARQILDRMAVANLTSEQYADLINQLQEALEAHVDLEEGDIFEMVSANMTPQQLQTLESQLAQEKQRAVQTMGGTTQGATPGTMPQETMPRQTTPRTY
jgi:iron-sulfur cluster repair protein YtfE (RIC family)